MCTKVEAKTGNTLIHTANCGTRVLKILKIPFNTSHGNMYTRQNNGLTLQVQLILGHICSRKKNEETLILYC